MRSNIPTMARTCAAGLAVSMLLAGHTVGQEAGGGVRMEKVEYKGWANNLRISNGTAELIVTLDVGPRIISYRLADGQNVFKEFEAELGKTGEPNWVSRGGHRLWAAPEDNTRTYAPDNGPVQAIQDEPGAVTFRPAPEIQYGLQKEIQVRLEPTGSRVAVRHRITNIGAQPTELAVWALSVMKAGGVEIIPMPEGHPHPGPPENAKSAADFAFDRILVLWPFFEFTDPRWTFGDDFIMLRQDPKRGPTKIGLLHRMDWAGYLVDGTLFVKRVPYQAGVIYPDGGVNFETFSNEEMLEMEGLGPLVRLAPGQVAEYTEHWELIPEVGTIENEEDIATKVVPKVSAGR